MNRLEYYRPRGVQGNYKAILKLQYISSETIEVIYLGASDPRQFRLFSSIKYSYSFEKLEAAVEGDVITYSLPPLKVGDMLFIRVTDKDIALPQLVFYITTKKNILRMIPSDVYYFDRYDWKRTIKTFILTEVERGHFDTVRKTEFKPIELVDMDRKDNH